MLPINSWMGTRP